MKQFLAILCFACFFNMMEAKSVKYKDCGSQLGIIKMIEVFPCLSFPCQLHKGKSYTINVTFTLNQNVNQGFAYAYGIVSGVKVPFPFKDKNACAGHSGIKCPLKSGSTYTYTATLPILKLYPDIKVLVEWDLDSQEAKWNMYNLNPHYMKKEKNANKIFCFKTLFQIAE